MTFRSGDDSAANHRLVLVILRLAEEDDGLVRDHLDDIAAFRRGDRVDRLGAFSIYPLDDRGQQSRSGSALYQPKD